jgi:hypothetical protein
MKASASKSTKTGARKKRAHNEAEGSAPESSPPSTPRPNPAKDWKKAELKTEDLLALVNTRFLQQKEMDLWRVAKGDPYPMEKNPNDILMFARFAEQGLALPASDFFKGLLRYYGIEYLNLNPNGVFHVSIFVHFCETVVWTSLGPLPRWVPGLTTRWAPGTT